MSNINLLKLFINLIIISSFFCHNIIKNITLEQEIKGKLSLDESHAYYLLNIPKDISKKVLVITTHQENDDSNDNDDFSDPDFYISKINKYPSSRLSSEWYSQRYGPDIITISPESVHGGDIFYIGIYCQFKCRYYLNTYVTHEIEIKEGTGYITNIKPKETGNLKLHVEQFDELKIVIYFRQRGKIKVLMSKDMPTTQNSFNVIPSWVYGYSIIVKKDTPEYCSNCDYHIFLKNEGKYTINNLYIFPIIQTERFTLRPHLPLYDTMEKNTKRCYDYPITKAEKEKEKFIVQMTVYSGKIDLVFEGWESKGIKDLNKYEGNKIENVIDEKMFFFDKKTFDEYDNEIEKYKGKDSKFNFCVFSKMESSFIISSYFLTKLEDFQKFRDINILLPDNLIKGYLLKDQVFKYDLTTLNLDKMEHNIRTNITIKLKNIIGKTYIYGYYCQNEQCTFNKNDISKLSEEKKLINPEEKNAVGEFIIEINNKNNYCYKLGKNAIMPNEASDKNDCFIIILVLCQNPNEENLCIYEIKMEIQDEPILMKPRQTYYGIIPIKKNDLYEIVITDPNIYNLIIVLNTESGDAELKVSKETSKGSILSLSSLHDDYIPDVIRISPKRLNSDNIIGKYQVKVFSKTFSTYLLYYYTTFKKEKSTNETLIANKEIMMNLEIGQIISEYFPMDIRYKIYSFSILLNQKENIKIFMNKINIGFNIYIYKDLSDFNIYQVYEMINNKNKEQITGYSYKSNLNNEINLKKEDYSLYQNYYIVIIPNLEFNLTKYFESRKEKINDEIREFNFIETVARKTSIKFYLGISTSESPLMIPEGVPHTMTLNEYYDGQLYYYQHFDIKKDFNLIINIIFGEIDIYVDIKKIKKENIEQLNDKENYDSDFGFYKYNSMIYYKKIKSYHEITLDYNYFKNYITQEKEKENSAKIYYYIKFSNSKNLLENIKECQYSIIERSSEKKDELLIPGETRTSVLPLGKKQYFIIEEVKKRQSGSINVFFKNGYGNVYVRIPKKPETDKKRFPDSLNYDYIGESIYSGKIIIIPKKVYDRLNYNNTKLQILITVEIEKGSYSTNNTNEVIFSINYSNEPKRINQNDPYDGFIKKGELQYFLLYFDSNTDNIYIGLSNMKGDADMYLNHGEILPTSKNYNWKSNQINHEFIDINKYDKFFMSRNISAINGFYSLLIIGFSDTSYTLFINNHKNIIFPLRNNKKATCLCKNIDDKCLFRFTDVFMNKNKEYGINYNEIIFTLNYLYGNGIIYAKVVKDEEISKLKNVSISQIFPTQDNYDISNKESKQRDYIKLQIKEEKYSEDSNILISFICSEPTKVDITSTSIRYFKTTDFIEENKENIYYLGFDPNSDEFQSDITLIFHNNDKTKDLIYSIHSYVGNAHVTIYSNLTWYDIIKNKNVNEYKEINSFDINSYNEQNNIIGSSPYNNDYHDVILANEKENFDNIIFKITPKNKFSFYIRCNYDKNFLEIPYGKMISYYAKNDEFYGYFDIVDEYTDIELSISLEKNLKMNAELYVKINILNYQKQEKSNNSNIYMYSIPNEENYDYKMETDKTLGTISLNMRNLPKLKEEEKNAKFIRGLFYIKINRIKFEPIQEEYIIKDKIKEMVKNQYEEKSLINILLTPGINNYKRVKTNPYIYYFSNLTYENSTKEKIPETKIWELRKDKVGHNIMVIEISSCSGEYSFKIQDHFISGVNNDDSLDYYEKKENGKHSIYINNLKSNIYYLSIEANENDVLCKMKNQGKVNFNCGNDLAYIMYYYTDYEQNLKVPKVETMLNYMPYGKGKIKVDLPEIIFRDINYNEREISDFKFDVFATKKKEYFDKLGNVCFLSRFVPSEDTIFTLEEMKITNKKSLIISGLGYRKQYYIGILMQNANTRELFAFAPLAVWSGGVLPYPLWEIILTLIIFVSVSVALIFFIIKYRIINNEIMEIKGDALPKNESDMFRNHSSEYIHYSGIGNNY